MNNEEKRISNNILKSYGLDIEKGRGTTKKIGELDKSGRNIKTANGWVPVTQRPKAKKSDKNEHGAHKGYLDMFRRTMGRCKAYNWSEANKQEYTKNVSTEAAARYLNTLPVHKFSGDEIPRFNPANTRDNYIAEVNGETYHVDTQGFDYPRYVAKLEGWTSTKVGLQDTKKERARLVKRNDFLSGKTAASAKGSMEIKKNNRRIAEIDGKAKK